MFRESGGQMKTKRLLKISALFLIAFFCFAGNSILSAEDQALSAPDYADSASWMFLPEDSNAQAADIFWVYPTIYVSEDNWNMPLDDKEAMAKAKEVTSKYLDMFEDNGNLYAPYYRQASLKVLSASEQEKEKYLGVAIEDAKNAFNFYLDNYNNGKPFILAGHSQGANVLLEMMKDMFASEQIRKKLVAAYIVGWSVTEDDLKEYPFLKIAQGPDDTGVIITYNVVADGFQDKSPTLLAGAVAVNPLCWLKSDIFMPAMLNEGAVFFDDKMIETIIPYYTGAQVKNGALVIPKIEDESQFDMLFGPGVYHVYDYYFFYENIRKNMKQRLRAFLQ